MYDANRLVWQLGDEQKERTPQGTVWSCRVVGESFGLIFNRLLLLRQEPRPQSILRGFCFWHRLCADPLGDTNVLVQRESHKNYRRGKRGWR